FFFAVSTPMSLASVHPIEMHNRDHSGLSNRSQSIGSSLEELHNYFGNSDAVLSIEELRLQLNSCFTCGVSWHEDHVSLDCRECGGYSLERPCPLCDGRCNSVWKRDLTMSHASGKARWEGECALRRQPEPSLIFKTITAEEESRLCNRLEKLGASS
ncbi:Protein pinocchio, partial [Cryptotermes secundus]